MSKGLKIHTPEGSQELKTPLKEGPNGLDHVLKEVLHKKVAQVNRKERRRLKALARRVN